MPEVVSNPKVSIIIPTYNRAHLLERSIHSVLAQTYTDFELIVVDDTSTDNTAEIVENIKDDRLVYIRHEINKGGCAARNTGIRVARGEYIAFQDSDDEWLLEKLEKQMRIFQTCGDDIGCVYSGFLRWDKGEAIYIPSSKIKTREGDISSQILQGNFVGTPTLLVRQELFENAGLFDEKLPRLQDWELVIRLAKICRFCLIDEPLVMVYAVPDSITNNDDALVRAIEIIIEKHYEEFSKTPLILAQHLWSAGHLTCLHKSVAKSRPFFLRSLRVYPWYMTSWFGLILSIFGQKLYKTIYNLKH